MHSNVSSLLIVAGWTLALSGLSQSYTPELNNPKIKVKELPGATTGRFFDVEYKIPPDLTKGKSRVVVRVQGHPNKTAGRVFGCRILKQ